MPSDSTQPRAPRSLSSSRMEAFSDGVFSIAATLLVLDLALHPPGTPLEQVLHAWPAYLGYVVSFLTIGAAWLLHSAMTDRLTRADSLLMRINLLLLLVIAFLPFPTKLVAEAHPRHQRRACLRHDVRADAAHHPPAQVRAGRVRPTRAPLRETHKPTRSCRPTATP